MKKILLASGSPRRADLLNQVGIPFETLSLNGEEEESRLDPSAMTPPEYAAAAASVKLDAALETAPGGAIVLCADTVVAVDGEIFGKPAGDDDARRMLRALSGRSHRVITACALSRTPGGPRCEFIETTTVEFRELSDRTIDAYIATGEPFDKAGGYGIQSRAAAFVKRVEGCYPNIVGLPVAGLAAVLKDVYSIEFAEFWNE